VTLGIDLKMSGGLIWMDGAAEVGFMSSCEYLSSCTYYNILKEKSPAILRYIKEEYCDSQYSECARFMVSKAHGPIHVPKYLFPEDIQEACKLLDELN
jgi:hypothetical protein